MSRPNTVIELAATAAALSFAATAIYGPPDAPIGVVAAVVAALTATVVKLTDSMRATNRRLARPPAMASSRVVAVIPAHNEEADIGATLDHLARQTRQPDQVLVVADNCTDQTVALSQAAGADVYETVGNTAKKAGALNQVLALLLCDLAPHDVVLIQDADSHLDREFIANALTHLERNPTLGAVGGTFRGGPGGGFVGYLQRQEYARYERDVRRLKGRCLVVTGTAAMFRARTLRAVSDARQRGTIPTGDGRGGVYDTTVLTEDNEITFALMHLGYKVASPAGCTLVTEVMPTWRDLWNQRLRWKRGAVENCFQYGMTRVTWPYWGRQAVAVLGILVTLIYLVSLGYAATHGGIHIAPVWLALTGVFVVERLVTTWNTRGWHHALLSATMYEIVYDLYLQVVHCKAYADVLLRRERTWS